MSLTPEAWTRIREQALEHTRADALSDRSHCHRLRMATVTVAPNENEWALGTREVEQLVAALEEEGHDAWLQEPRDGSYSTGGLVTDPLVDVSLFLWEHVGPELLGVLVTLTSESLRRQFKRKRKAKAVLYGPNGEVLRTIELPADRDTHGPPRQGAP